jgi:two-component system cell cycle sensor histidine kinase PleC
MDGPLRRGLPFWRIERFEMVDRAMNVGSDKDDKAESQWPVFVTLVLCALFAAVVAIRVKSEHDNHRALAIAGAMQDARLAASQIDAALGATRAGLLALSPIGAAGAGPILTALPGVESAAAFDEAGRILAQSGADPGDLAALAAAAEVADAEGWTGAVARPDGQVVTAMSVRMAGGGAVALRVEAPKITGLAPGRRVIVADASGRALSVTPAPARAFTQTAPAAFGLRAPDPALGATAHYATGPGGEEVVLGLAPSRTGLWAYVARPRGPVDLAWNRTALFFLLLFLGPVLCAAGIWFIVRGQSERFGEAKAQLRDAERRLRIAIEGARCGVWDWDISEDRVYLTQRLAQAFGLSGAGRFDTAEVMSRLPADDAARLRAALTAAAQVGGVDVTLKVPGPQGVAHVQLRGRAAVDRRTPGSIRAIGVSIDVSEQRDVEARVMAAERRLRDAINSISGPFALWSRDRRLVLWNDGFLRAFGLDAATLRAGASYADVSAAAAKGVRSQRPDRYDERAQEIELDNGVWLQLVERETSDGGLVSIGVDISPLKETEEEILKSERQMRSVVSELERSERQAADLAEKYAREKMRAEEASSAKSTFLANMSHELRTPLNAINGFSEIMVQQLYGPLGDPRYQTYASDILASGQHLLELINDVLDMAKLEAGKFTIHPAPMDLEDTIRQAIRMTRGRAEGKRITIESDLKDAGDMVGDARAIRQILINLLSNAIKFTEDGGRVLVQTREDFSSVTIRVVDTGIGIPADHLPRLGRPFEQVESEHAKAHQGTGLGLALCRSFAEMHGGSLAISSEVGVGTMVTVTLPKDAMYQRQAA